MVILVPVIHKSTLCIGLKGKYNAQVRSLIRSSTDLIYSSTFRCYYMACTPVGLENLRKTFRGIDCSIEGGWPERVDFVAKIGTQPAKVLVPASYHEHLIKRRYSKATCDNYLAQFKAFLSFIYPTAVEDFSETDIHEYQLFLVKTRAVTHSTQNVAINAIKFYLEQVKKGERRKYMIERPRGECKLPTVLSEEEIKALFSRTHYIKHKCMLLLLYSAGLRISELLNLKHTDIDRDRSVIMSAAEREKKTALRCFLWLPIHISRTILR